MNETAPSLILASGSAHRARLLERLGLPFSQDPPDIDESPVAGEEPARLAVRLAREKASVVAARHPGAIVIGSDQVAMRDGRALGKPASAEAAREQLAASAGKEMEFLTAVCVLPADREREPEEHMDITRVVFRPLDHGMIGRYISRDHPLDCAGSFRSESLGIALVERIDSHDPTALVGLPLIWLSGALARLGLPAL
ncbi:MAG: Maf family protein [Gammaproteobacteria bacterium]